ncbi:Protein tpx2 [Cladochytrium tenue]|nr:Protein tpx2 [Cladochytrium tenue]
MDALPHVGSLVGELVLAPYDTTESPPPSPAPAAYYTATTQNASAAAPLPMAPSPSATELTSVRGSLTPRLARPAGALAFDQMPSDEITTAPLPTVAAAADASSSPDAAIVPVQDRMYEFSAPRFHVFSADDSVCTNRSVCADSWFDHRHGSPNGSVTATVSRPVASAELIPSQQPAPTDLAAIFRSLAVERAEQAVSAGAVAAMSPAPTSPAASPPRRCLLFPRSDHEAAMGRARPANPFFKPSVAPRDGKTARTETVSRRANNATTQNDRSRRTGRPLDSVKGPTIAKRANAPRKPLQLTIPKPFRFASTLRELSHFVSRKGGDDENCTSPYMPLAAKIKRLEQEVPDRFKTKATKPLPSKPRHLELTHPRSPRLMTKFRIKNYGEKLTTEEIEARELAKVQPFKARPLAKKIFEAPVGIPHLDPLPLTVPQSPAIHKPAPPAPRAPSPPRVIRANPIRLPAEPFEPRHEPRAPVVPADVRLPGDELRARRLREFEEAVKREAEEAERARRFRARPMRDPAVPDSLPAPPPKAPTVPEPFMLHTAARSAMYPPPVVPEPAPFVAHPLPAFDAPFVPRRSERPATVPEDVVLHTDARAAERREYEEALRAKEAAEEEMRAHIKVAEEEQERERIRLLRRELVPRAQPIRHFPGIDIRPSRKKLTEPESPMLFEKRRRLQEMQQRLQQEQQQPHRSRFDDYSIAAPAEAADEDFGGAWTSPSRRSSYDEVGYAGLASEGQQK